MHAATAGRARPARPDAARRTSDRDPRGRARARARYVAVEPTAGPGTTQLQGGILAELARTLPAALWTVDADLAVEPAALGAGLAGFPAAGRTTLFAYLGIADPDDPAIVAHRAAMAGTATSFSLRRAGRDVCVFVEPRPGGGATGLALDAGDAGVTLASLRASQEALALAQSAARLGSWTQDVDDGGVAWSDELYALCGLEPQALAPDASLLWRFVHPDDRLALEVAIEFAREEGQAFVVDTRLVRADGGERWVQHRGRHVASGGATRVVGTVLDITGRKRAEEHLAYRTNHDELTGLPNRKLLADRLHQAMMLAQHNAAALAVFSIDLDRFKRIADTLGHDAGDRFVERAAPRLRAAVRETDTVARTGGDEFVVVLPEIAGAGEAGRIAERIVAAFAEPVTIDGRELYASAHVGIGLFPEDGSTPEELVRAADAALVRAKRDGNAAFRFFASATHASTVDRLELEHALRRAYDRDEFVLHYQPMVDRFERVAGVEALLRWQNPSGETIGPDRFIPLCEETGLIVPLGRRVLREALAQYAAWAHAGVAPPRIALNLSARQFADPSLAATLADALRASGVPAARVELEITESALAADVPAARRVVDELKTLGVRIALDDFGTGYSALSYLKYFNVDALKIDRSFVRDLPGDAGDAAIVSAVVALGHAMSLSVVAEGVETAEQAACVRRLGCDEMQGFHYVRPAPAAAIEAYVRARAG